MDHLTGRRILDLNRPFGRLLIPLGTTNLMVGFAVLVKTMLVHEIIEILEDLARFCVHSGPVQLWLERVDIVVAGNIARAAAK